MLRHPIHAICSAYEMDLRRRRHQKRQFDTNFGTFFNTHLEEWKAVVDRWIIFPSPDIKKIIISFDDIVKNPKVVFSDLSNFFNTKIIQLYNNTEKYISCQKLKIFRKIKFDLYDDIIIKYRKLLGFNTWDKHK